MSDSKTEVYESFVEEIPADTIKLDVKNLNFFYGKNQSLHNVSIPFQRQSITGLIGPSLSTTVFAWAITGGAGLGQPGLGILLAAFLVFLALIFALRFARPPVAAPG